MSKKKGKKNRNKQVNPHKLSEMQLKEKIDQLIVKQSVDDAYSLAKVLLERFESEDNISLFQSILNQKINKLESSGKSQEAAQLIVEAKKRFSISFFKEADEFIQLRNLDDDQLIDQFCNKETIPELFRYQLADILYFSENKNRQFIKRHKQYKDVFYVKEAFQNGYDPIKTPKILAVLKTASPYKPWFLLHKAIQAFQEGDGVTLELVNKKLTDASFPSFLSSKLLDCQRYLEGKNSDVYKITKDDLEIFKALCGEHCTFVFTISNIVNLQKVNLLPNILSKLKWIEKNQPKYYPDILYLCLINEISKDFTRFQDTENLYKIIAQVKLPEILGINKTHLFIKLGGFTGFDEYQLEEIVDSLINSREINQNQFFNPKRLKAEILFYYAKSLRPPGKRSRSFFSRFLNGYDSDESQENPVIVLEKALKFSDHNPEIFTLLINYYLKAKEKTSKINKIVDRLLSKFPLNPEGFELAGKISFQNKAYTKAIDYFDKAKELMPLNKDFTQTILDCFEGIIEKRTKTNRHLIDKDLERAAAYVDRKRTSTSGLYKLLGIKALLKKYSLSIVSLEELQLELKNQLEFILGNSRVSLKLVLYLSDLIDKKYNLIPILDLILNQIISQLDQKTYLVFLQYALTNEDVPPDSFYKTLPDLTFHFLRLEKKEKSLSLDQHLELILLVLSEDWNRTFIAFVCLARCCFPQDKIFALFECLILTKVNHKRISELLYDNEIINWLLSPIGKKVVKKLAMLNDTFDELDSLISGTNDNQPGELVELFNELAPDFPADFRDFSVYLIEESDQSDDISLKEVKKIFDIPIRTAVTRKSVNYGANGLLDNLYGLGQRETKRRIQEEEKRRQEENKKWKEEQQEKRKIREEQAAKKKKLIEEMEAKNDQIDFFDMLNDEDAS